ncbi:MAG: M20/M25/M40 family metallo-hydrolase [Lachnospiraceae bacterium]|nr:M20/M25/M40 family metallo-hydrolase [Lachnospiraceae bacterium]
MNREEIIHDFIELAKIDSPSFGERKMADAVKAKLSQLGIEVSEDDAGSHYQLTDQDGNSRQGSAGNLFAKVPGTLPGGPILLCSHLDTVDPALEKKPILHEDGRITSDGTTVLGSDDLAGVTEILSALRIAKEKGLPHRDLELIFPIGEELYDKGTKVFDFSKITSKQAYILDMSGPVGAAALQAPSIISYQITVEGKASHAGFNPEDGVHAIAIASQAISKVRQGHLDSETTLNIGTITGGVGTNIVPEICTITGEIRSYVHEKAMKALENLAEIFRECAKEAGASIKEDHEIHIYAYKTGEEENVVKEFKASCQRLGLPGTLTSTFGGSDNNNFALHQIPGLVLSCGMSAVHSVHEYVESEDLIRGTQLVLDLITH